MARTQHARRLRPYTFRPRLEALEDRNLMTAGALDPTFGTAGLASTGVLPTFNGAPAMALQSDGKAVLVGDYAHIGSGPDGFTLVRFNTDGSVDRSFGVSGGAFIDFGGNGGTAQAVALQPDGKIIVAGYTAVPVGSHYVTAFGVCRLNRDGTLDTAFGTGGEQSISFGADQLAYGQSVVLQPDGKIVVAGHTSPLGGPYSAFAIARLNNDGSIDTTFGVGGRQSLSISALDADANSLALQPDGKIVVAGYTQYARFTQSFRVFTSVYTVVRLNPDGSPDASFGAGGEQTLTFAGAFDATADAVLVQPGGKIILAGQVMTGSGSEAGIARLNSDGSLDRSFGTGGEVEFTFGASAASGDYDSASSLALEADGKLVVAGTAYQPDAQTAEFGLARLNPNGSFDATFAGGGRDTTSFGEEAFARSVALAPDGKIVVAGGWVPQFANPFSTQWAVARYAGDRGPFSYDQTTKTLTVAATNFVFSQTSAADASGVHTSYAFIADGVPLHLSRTLVSNVVVNGRGAGNAYLYTNDTYTGTDGQTHETVESVVLGNGKGKLYRQGDVLPFLVLSGFTTMDAYLGRADAAALHATPGALNLFVTTPGYSYLSAPGSFYLVSGAPSVYGYAAGPADQAYLYGGAGPTTFTASDTAYSSITGTDHGVSYYNEALGFTHTHAFATRGNRSTAYLNSASAGAVFVGRTNASYLYRFSADGTFAEFDFVQSFARVFATATGGAIEYAYVYDTTVNHATGFRRLI